MNGSRSRSSRECPNARSKAGFTRVKNPLKSATHSRSRDNAKKRSRPLRARTASARASADPKASRPAPDSVTTLTSWNPTSRAPAEPRNSTRSRYALRDARVRAPYDQVPAQDPVDAHRVTGDNGSLRRALAVPEVHRVLAAKQLIVVLGED